MKNTLLAMAILAMSQLANAQTGKVFDNLTMDSETLKMERRYAIYLPPDYESSERSYPVLYLLHGSGDDQTGWVQFGEVLRIADKAILEGSATAMIIVMPDANRGQRGFFNDPKNEWRYEDFFFEEFMPFVEKTYRIKGEKRYGADVSEEELMAWYQQHSAVELVNDMPDKQKKEVRWFIDCGDDDFLFEGNSLVHIAMRKREIPHEFRIRNGGHTWTYWRESLPEVLSFVSDAFHQH
jgi:enterochelin esterase-like enzyme